MLPHGATSTIAARGYGLGPSAQQITKPRGSKTFRGFGARVRLSLFHVGSGGHVAPTLRVGSYATTA